MRASVGGGVKYGHTCGWITPQHCALLACSPVPNNKCEHICVVFGFQICRESASSMCSYSSYKCCVKRYCEPIDADCQNANDCNGLYTRCYTPSDCSAQFETKCGDPTPSGQCGP
ncbi:MAG: hypothetical protein FJX74_05970 [Armatimonadetes bacterium]|nr:hypothetical protein [Armatimonadota bacterium]